MSEGVTAALITGVLSLAGVLITLFSRRLGGSEGRKVDVQKLRGELEQAQRTAAQLRAEAERYRTAYLGLAELTQELLEEQSPGKRP
jgi:uncharacterized protein YlxW (UPF0749 family)